MGTQKIDEARVRTLSDAPARDGAYVLYWMQQSQRARTNHALEHAVRRANEAGLPLLVGFGLMDGYPGANLRHYRFMLEGLRQTAAQLARRSIGFVLRRGAPDEVCLRLAKDAALVVCDRGVLRHQRRWRRRVAEEAGREVVQVEADTVVPLDVASDKREYAARTLRPKIARHRDAFLHGLRTTPLAHDGTALGVDGETLTSEADVDALLDDLDVDRSVPPVSHVFEGGTSQANARLAHFVERLLADYDDSRLEPSARRVSHLSPYLHFGQIAAIDVALAVDGADAPRDAREAYLEELIVRRELAMNYCAHEPRYDAFAALPDWAKRTLAEHADDEREHVYTARELERAETHDPWWNAAMREMRYTGYMHNAMRMYWGKRILAWTNTPEHAFRTALELNDRYFLDGRDANSVANVAWLFGLHDRPWKEREVFGKVRIMTASGLKRKYDMDAYVAWVDAQVGEAEAAGVRFEDD
ncbi:MAG TPA: deoxyribodipyrimidine photo-lyase [Sandaracinaceae bacterium LLY-WYZ-13_1]|nr:deoxyribodipyrimidine photo-lyase [Sandaracinaceae bacterium LLY-WYZ-13_1]